MIALNFKINNITLSTTVNKLRLSGLDQITIYLYFIFRLLFLFTGNAIYYVSSFHDYKINVINYNKKRNKTVMVAF